MRGTYRAILDRLRAAPGLIYRDETSLPQAEGAFGICSAWVTEHLAGGGGSLAEAEGWFRQFLGYGNDLGLFAEEVDPATGAALGNFPQAYSHVGLISAALAIEARRRAELLDRPRGSAPAAGAGSERADMNWASWLLWGFAATAVLTTVMAGSEGVGLTRMNIPHMLGTMFTPNRDRAKVYGAALHFLNGWAFSIVYVAGFHAAHRFTWWFGMFLGLIHGLFVPPSCCR